MRDHRMHWFTNRTPILCTMGYVLLSAATPTVALSWTVANNHSTLIGAAFDFSGRLVAEQVRRRLGRGVHSISVFVFIPRPRVDQASAGKIAEALP